MARISGKGAVYYFSNGLVSEWRLIWGNESFKRGHHLVGFTVFVNICLQLLFDGSTSQWALVRRVLPFTENPLGSLNLPSEGQCYNPSFADETGEAHPRSVGKFSGKTKPLSSCSRFCAVGSLKTP